MQKTGILALLLMSALLLIGSSCSPKAATAKIKIISDIEKLEEHAEYPGEFWPEHITIGKGTMVTWTNDDAKEHTVTSDGFFNHKLSPKASFTYTFKDSGNFTYHCDYFHEMVGVVVVE